MQADKLTKNQKSLLNWVVQEVRAGKLDEEEIWITWSFNGTSIVNYEGHAPEIKTITLDAMQESGYLICDRSREHQYKCALTNRAYEMVDSEFSRMNKIKILFFAADPSDVTRLRLGQELRDIREKLQLSKQRDSFVLDSRESVRPGDITQAIHDVAPQIVHFSGHGANTGELCFENVLGKAQLVEPDALADLFELIAEEVSCVVLNACYSETQAKAISKHIPFVVGMNTAIGDKAAITFAVGFYKALGAGRSFEKAYKFAQVEMKLEGISENLTPVLYIKDDISSPVMAAETLQQSQALLTQVPTSSKEGQSSNLEEVLLAYSSEIVTLEEAIKRFDVAPIIKHYGTWAVTTYGVECLSTYYSIEMSRVDELDWLDHMQSKIWTNMPDFAGALSYARELSKIRQSFSISGKNLKVFLCHGNEDKPAVRQIYYRLLASGIEPWLDEENLLPGQDRKYEITRAVRASDVVIVCLSSSSVSKSGFVQKEIKYALDVADEKPEGSIFLIPAKLEECSLPDQLSGKHWVDLFQKQGFDRLIRSLQACVARQQQP
ncbi:TIR domain-containing protein [Stenomitos frigidus]|uniref:TIR domain-containing protein n=1 Tax=Stenomitos frigidus TaxID=1886765 RepID=UPI0015E796CF|nr:TIR domain-containing protein [Stenomitos frigidus]